MNLFAAGIKNCNDRVKVTLPYLQPLKLNCNRDYFQRPVTQSVRFDGLYTANP